MAKIKPAYNTCALPLNEPPAQEEGSNMGAGPAQGFLEFNDAPPLCSKAPAAFSTALPPVPLLNRVEEEESGGKSDGL